MLLLLPAIGGLISGLIVFTWASEAEGHGTNASIDAFLQSKYDQIPIEDAEVGVIGVLQFENLIKAYHDEIQKLKEG